MPRKKEGRNSVGICKNPNYLEGGPKARQDRQGGRDRQAAAKRSLVEKYKKYKNRRERAKRGTDTLRPRNPAPQVTRGGGALGERNGKRRDGNFFFIRLVSVSLPSLSLHPECREAGLGFCYRAGLGKFLLKRN